MLSYPPPTQHVHIHTHTDWWWLQQARVLSRTARLEIELDSFLVHYPNPNKFKETQKIEIWNSSSPRKYCSDLFHPCSSLIPKGDLFRFVWPGTIDQPPQITWYWPCGDLRILHDVVTVPSLQETTVWGDMNWEPRNSPKKECARRWTKLWKTPWGAGPMLKYNTTACTTQGSVLGNPCFWASSQSFLMTFWCRNDKSSVSSKVISLASAAAILLWKSRKTRSHDHMTTPCRGGRDAG